MVCAPGIATTAYFVAVILLDLYNREWNRIPGHALFGVFAVLMILFICERGSEFMAWILLGAPLVIVFLFYFLSKWLTKDKTPGPSNGSFKPSCGSCPCCSYRPCRCRRRCWKPKPPCPKCPDCPSCPDCPKPEPKPKPDNCIKTSLDE
jgi:hypothetical protein